MELESQVQEAEMLNETLTAAYQELRAEIDRLETEKAQEQYYASLYNDQAQHQQQQQAAAAAAAGASMSMEPSGYAQYGDPGMSTGGYVGDGQGDATWGDNAWIPEEWEPEDNYGGYGGQ